MFEFLASNGSAPSAFHRTCTLTRKRSMSVPVLCTCSMSHHCGCSPAARRLIVCPPLDEPFCVHAMAVHLQAISPDDQWRIFEVICWNIGCEKYRLSNTSLSGAAVDIMAPGLFPVMEVNDSAFFLSSLFSHSSFLLYIYSLPCCLIV